MSINARHAEPPEVRAKIQKWLSPTEFSSESSDFNKHLRSYVPKTGEWLRSSDRFTQWHQQGNTALWVNGIPGSGKSVVAATLIRDFVNVENAPVLFFFFRHANLANRTPQQMTRDWLSQLLEHSPLLQSLLKDLMEKHPRHGDVAFDHLWECICSATSNMRKVYCVADALDEMEKGNDWFLVKLIELGQQKPSTLKVVTTSRQSPHIEAVFKRPFVVDINLSRRLIDQDIATYIDHLLRDPSKLAINSQDREVIKSTIQTKASGLFLYAKLMMDEVLRNLNHQPLDHLLSGLPTGVDGMYTTLLKEHSMRSGVPRDLQEFILQWVTHASRPLRLLEVAEIIRSTVESKGLENVQIIKNTIRTACGPLLTILPDETLQVIHHSFTEFLVADTRSNVAAAEASYPIFDSPSIHRNAAITSVRYLVSCSVMRVRSQDDQQKQTYSRVIDSRTRDNLLVEHPLLQYATANWMVHASKFAECDATLARMLDDFFNLERDDFSYWQGVWRVSEQGAVQDAVLHPLHVLAHFGLTPYLTLLCQRGWKVDSRDSAGRTPLSYACERGHVGSVKLLLSHGASVSAQSSIGIAPIHYACSTNQPAIVKCLLEAGADPLHKTSNVEGRHGMRLRKDHTIQQNRYRFGIHPMNHVCAHGYRESLTELLKFIDPKDLQPGPINWAAERGLTEIVIFLLQTGHIEPNLKDGQGNTPLCLAARRRSPSTVKALLQAGADINERSCGIDRSYGLTDHLRKDGDINQVTPLHAWACSSGWCESLQDLTDTGLILLRAGCDINAKDSEGKSPLFYWSKFNDFEWTSVFLKVLLDNGADATVTDNLGNTALHSFTGRHADIHIQLLINAGGDMNARRKLDGQTPLMCLFSEWSRSKPVDWHTYAQKYSIDPNAQDLEGRTVLHKVLASDAWDVSKIAHWLQAGADPNIEDAQGQNCLFTLKAIHNFKQVEEPLIRVLQTAGIDLDAKDHRGRNVALNAVCRKDVEELRRLKSYGFDLTARDYQGKTSLHILSSRETSYHSTTEYDKRRRIEYMKLFLDEGLDPNTRDYAGNTMLHEAIQNTGPFFNSSHFLLHTALEVGADPASRNYKGRTVLHLAAGLPIKHELGYSGCDGEKRLDHLLSPQFSLDINLADHDGITALHLASTICASRVTKLLRAGADVTAVDHQKRTVLHYAARGGNANALGVLTELLTQKFLDEIIDHSDCNGRTALHDAVRSGVLESVQILLDASANPNARDFRGKSSLYIASECHEERSFMELQRSSHQQLTRKCDMYPADGIKQEYASHPAGLQLADSSRPVYMTVEKHEDSKSSRSCLEIVSRVTDIVRLLLDAGSDPCVTDNNGRTPYNAAVANGCKEIACALAFSREPAEQSSVTVRAQPGRESRTLARLKQRNWELERMILDQAVRDSVSDPEEATSLLLFATQVGDKSMIEELLSVGADPLKALADGKTILHAIARNGLLSIMKLLVRGKHVQSLPNDLIHEAVRRERPNTEMIKFLVHLGVDLNAKQDMGNTGCSYVDDNKTAIHLLAVAEHWWNPLALDYLLTVGADPEQTTSQGKTALQLAIKGRSASYDQPGFWRKDAIAVLLKHNARVNFVNSEGRTPLVESFKEGVDIVETLISHGADIFLGDDPPISDAVTSFNPAVVEALVRAGADCNAMCQSWRTDLPKQPLLLRIACGRLNSGLRRDESEEDRRVGAEEIIGVLLKNGADPTKILEDGTPLLTAVVQDFGILRPFLSLDLDLEVTNSQGMTPLLAACSCQSESAVRSLIDAGANMLAVDHERMNALHWICKVTARYYSENECEIAKKLIASGTPVSDLDDVGFSPLHYAIKRQSHGMIVTLLNANANPAEHYPGNSKTALHFLLPCMAEDGGSTHRKEYIPLVQKFIDAGIDREQRDSQGNTAIFGYVAVRPSYDDEYHRDNIYPDLEEQRRVLSRYNVHARNKEGQTLMHIVAKRSRENANLPQGRDDTRDMFKILWELGVGPKAEDNQQRTPLDVAAACGNRGILDLFAPVEDP